MHPRIVGVILTLVTLAMVAVTGVHAMQSADGPAPLLGAAMLAAVVVAVGRLRARRRSA
jgi:hypothetical protein